MTSLPEQAYAVALASLMGVGPVRLRALLAWPASEAWDRLKGGNHPADPQHRWREASASIDVADIWRRHRAADVQVALPADPEYPRRLVGDDQGPAVLFVLGDPAALELRPTVAVVGTRSATRYGIGLAAQFGAELSALGITVVSGLALGIDGAAHEGACAAVRSDPASAAPPLAVVAGGLDDPYPRRHARLWERVAAAGAIVSECPLGVGNETWRFPLRNRLLAALAQLIVVVECHDRGGSLHTVAAADRRGIPVGAVPGSVRSPASSGTNTLLADGAFPVRDTTDIVVALSLVGGEAAGDPMPPVARMPPDAGRAQLDGLGEVASSAAMAGWSAWEREDQALGSGDQALVLGALDAEPVAIEDIMRRTGLTLRDVAFSLQQLAERRLVNDVGGGWWCRVEQAVARRPTDPSMGV